MDQGMQGKSPATRSGDGCISRAAHSDSDEPGISVFGWMNDHLLRMAWLDEAVGKGVAAIGLDPASRVGGSLQFFVYDVIKIFILLSVLIFAISHVQSHFPVPAALVLRAGLVAAARSTDLWS